MKARSKESMIFLNTYRVNILDLRRFLASLNEDGDTEIGAADLLMTAKALSRIEVSPLRGLPSDLATPE